MNGIQTAIAKVTGFGDVIDEMTELEEQVENLTGSNALLQRQLEDLDYINLFDINNIQELFPTRDRRKVLLRLRRMRQDNPIAKQSVKLILRFTLGKGVQYVITSDPSGTNSLYPTADSGGEGDVQSGAAGAGTVSSRLNVTEAFAPASPPGAPASASTLPEASKGSVVPFPKKPAVPPKQPGLLPDGPGPDVAINDQIKEIWNSFWNDDDNQLAFTTPGAMQEWLDAVVTDGEYFFVAATSNAAPYAKLTDIPVEEVETIIYSTDNKKRPIYYKRVWQNMKYDGEAGRYVSDGSPSTKYYLDYRVTPEILTQAQKSIKIPKKLLADEKERVIHTMINPITTMRGRRGLSELYASREWFRVFREFMEDRAAINKAATSIAHKRKIKGSPATVAQFDDKFGGLTVGYDAENNADNVIRKLTRPTAAGIYNSNQGVDMEWMKTDTGAVNAKEDARGLLMAGGAGMGINSHYFGEGGDSNLATAQAMELPMVKSFEDWQNFVSTICMELVKFVLSLAMDPEEAKDELHRFAFSFPPIISQDVVKWITAWTQVVTSVAPGNKIVRQQAIRGALGIMGVTNIDGLMPQIIGEEVVAEAERKAQQQAMVQAMSNNPLNPTNPADPTNPANPAAPPTPLKGKSPFPPAKGARNGSGQLDPQLKRVVNGKPPVAARNGPKPPR